MGGGVSRRVILLGKQAWEVIWTIDFFLFINFIPHSMLKLTIDLGKLFYVLTHSFTGEIYWALRNVCRIFTHNFFSCCSFSFPHISTFIPFNTLCIQFNTLVASITSQSRTLKNLLLYIPIQAWKHFFSVVVINHMLHWFLQSASNCNTIK